MLFCQRRDFHAAALTCYSALPDTDRILVVIAHAQIAIRICGVFVVNISRVLEDGGVYLMSLISKCLITVHVHFVSFEDDD